MILLMIHIYMEQGRVTKASSLPTASSTSTINMGVPCYQEYLWQQKWGLYSILSVKETQGGIDLVSYSLTQAKWLTITGKE